MRAPRWEYESVQIDASGWISPDVQPDRLDAELNAYGEAGWELVSAFDVNRGRGRTSAVVALFERPRD